MRNEPNRTCYLDLCNFDVQRAFAVFVTFSHKRRQEDDHDDLHVRATAAMEERTHTYIRMSVRMSEVF